MTIQITGKNLDAGNAYQAYAGDKIRSVLQKYLDSEPDGHIRLERERGLFRTTCSVRLGSGLLIEARGEGGDAYSSVDAARHRLEARVRRYKSRIKDHVSSAAAARRQAATTAPDYVISVTDEEQPEQDAANPVIIAESERNIRYMTVSEAVMQLDLADAYFLIFRNAAHGGLNVVYRRSDGNVGWVDARPPVTAEVDAAAARESAS
jgi:ribosomal subunit interface protein